MSRFSEARAKKVIGAFLSDLRQAVKQRSLTLSRLPPWVETAKVRIGWIGDSLVAVFEAAAQDDSYQVLGPIHADTVLLLNTRDFRPTGASLRGVTKEGLVILCGTRTDTVINLVGEHPALFDCGYAGYHSPIALSDLIFQHTPKSSEAAPLLRCLVPFALYVHQRDTAVLGSLWSLCKQNLMDHMISIHDSTEGDSYQQQHGPRTILTITKKSGVIVLGKYSGSELQELRQVQDRLQKKGYSAQLIKDIPDISEMSNEEKVRFWSLTARFCIMIDRVPAGQIAEYLVLREQRSVLAVLRPIGSGSTYMIGDDTLVDVNFIRVFEFEGTPLSVLDHAIAWAEETIRQRAQAYGKAYPWRRNQTP